MLGEFFLGSLEGKSSMLRSVSVLFGVASAGAAFDPITALKTTRTSTCHHGVVATAASNLETTNINAADAHGLPCDTKKKPRACATARLFTTTVL
jgi:hypothetical protein